MSEYTPWMPGGGEWSSQSAMVRTVEVAPNGMVVLGADDGDHIYIANGSGKIVQSLRPLVQTHVGLISRRMAPCWQ